MSPCRRTTRRPLVLIACALTIGLATASVSQAAGPAGANPRPTAPLPGALSTFLGDAPALPDLDVRRTVAPTAAVRKAAAAVHPQVTVSWNSFGTPASLTARGGAPLATGLSKDAVTAARTFLATHRAAFGLSAAEVRALELVNDAHLIGSPAHAVLLRQTWGTRAHAVEGGLVAVGVREGSVVSVTSTLAPGLRLNTTTPTLSPAQALLTAARDAGYRSLKAADVRLGAVVTGGAEQRTDAAGFTLLTAEGLAGTQRTRLAVLPTPSGARLVWETDVLDVQDGRTLATMTFVDAVSGAVLVRRDAVDTLAAGAGVPHAAAITSAGVLAAPTAPSTFAADFTGTACGKPVALTVPAGTRSITLAGTADQPENDVEFQVFRGAGLVGSSDTGGGQEVVQVSLASPATAADAFTVAVCPSKAPLGPFVAPFTAHGAYSTDTASSSAPSTQQAGVPYAPSWKYFQDSPNLTAAKDADDDVRTTACWTTDQKDPAVNKDLSGCQESVGSAASGQPWDVDARTGLSTFTTTGNNAFTADAREGSTLTPGATAYQPRSLTRDYGSTFTDQWHASGCDPATLVPTGADQDAAITNLFTGHNIMHDFSYRLGFTERGYNMQMSNKGNTGPSQENDPEVGNVHSGAVTNEAVVVASTASGVAAPVTGRDNANQITLQDGTPGITNQYMFQPLVGFYGPCADGDLDFSIFGHEYTHAISNRMVAGPDTGLSGAQAGSMGESWSDLDALEAMHELGIAGKRGENPDSVGAYATNNKDRGIRDFALNANPLNYGDFGFDATGPEVHADGEIWNGVQWHVRDALVAAHAADTAANSPAGQLACATGRTTSAGTLSAPASGFEGCSGNRRWIQYVYDSFLLQASGSPTFFDMSNLMLAAATLRGSAGDRAVMATALAQRGLGTDTLVKGAADTDPVAGFASEVASDNGTVSFQLKDSDTDAPVAGQVYLGVFQARVTPFADTAKDAASALGRTVAAGSYDVLVRADGYGLQRRVLTVAPGRSSTLKISLAKNLASASNGATITGDGVRLGNLIDDSEATDGGSDGSAAKKPVAGTTFTVALAGGLQKVQKFSLSALHHPASAAVPGDFQGRLLGVRGFHLEVSKDGGATYQKVYESKDFFPAVAPRPVAPDLVLRDAVLPSAVDADHVRLVVDSNQCTGAPAYQGDQDADPLNNADCSATANAYKVTVTELEVFGKDAAKSPGFVGGGPATGLAAAVTTTRK